MSRLPSPFAKHRKITRQQRRRPQTLNRVDEAIRMAQLCFESGDVAQAEKLCVAVLASDPRELRALTLAGLLARHVGDLSLSVNFFQRVVALQPNSIEARINLAATHDAAREHEEAARHLEYVLTRKPDHVGTLGALGKSYTATGRAELALPLFEKATKLQPHHESLRYDHANALIALGHMEEASILLRDSIALGYRVAQSYRLLADSQKYSSASADLEAILSMLRASEDLQRRDRVLLNHAAGKILNDLGRFDEAIDHYQISKFVTGYGFDIEAYRQRIDTLVAAFSPQLLQSKKSFGNFSQVPVFIVGMPRSGTTLTEQICASHPAVHGAGELGKLETVVQKAGYTLAPNGFIQKPVQSLTADQAHTIAGEYLDFVRRKSPSAARIVDKMPHNFQLVGMIALLFPNAKIIHCTRNPIDNCLSCFFNTFNEKHGYNADLYTLGLYYREYRRLMNHWSALLPGRIYECNYETMIADQVSESRRLIEFLGLPWDEACVRFYETDRSVTTPSRWQVRQPIYQTSVKRWKRYEDKIQPLIESLGDLAVE